MLVGRAGGSGLVSRAGESGTQASSSAAVICRAVMYLAVIYNSAVE